MPLGEGWFKVTIDPILGATGGYAGAVHIVSDITERKRIEEALRDSEERLDLAVKGANLGLWDWNIKTGDTIFSESWAEMLGYQLDALAPHAITWETRIHPDDKDRVMAVLNQHFEDDDFEYNAEFRLKTKTGDWKWVNSRGKVFDRDEEKKPLRMVGTLIDISAIKQAEDALIKSEAEYRHLVESTQDWVWACDPAGRQTFANDAVKNILGYETQEIIGAATDSFIHPEDAGRVQTWFKKSVEIKKGWTNAVLRWKHKDGTTKFLESTASPVLDSEGNLIGFTGIDRDVTERLKVEQQLLQTQKMEAIGTLAGGVAHDFNNLLSVILGNADLMLMELRKDHPFYNGIKEVRKAGTGAASLTRQLLAFSRQQVIQPEIINLNDVLNATAKMLERLIDENVDFQTILDPVLEPVKADSGQMEQVIINLAVNARDAMPSGGKLTVETKNLYLDEDFFKSQSVEGKAGPYVMLRVSDTGSGMDQEILFQIFDPFFTTKGLEKGTGLGLATVYGIVKQNNGYVFVDSKPGKGSAFELYLPAAKGEKETVTAEIFTADSLSGTETILLVEDDMQLQKLTARILERYNYRVLLASNADEALKVSQKYDGPIDLILADVIMPGSNIRDVAERIQSRRMETKILYMSGHMDDTIAPYGILEPGINFLQKPYTPEGLVRKIREVLDRRIDD